MWFWLQDHHFRMLCPTSPTAGAWAESRASAPQHKAPGEPGAGAAAEHMVKGLLLETCALRLFTHLNSQHSPPPHAEEATSSLEIRIGDISIVLAPGDEIS